MKTSLGHVDRKCVQGFPSDMPAVTSDSGPKHDHQGKARGPGFREGTFQSGGNSCVWRLLELFMMMFV